MKKSSFPEFLVFLESQKSEKMVERWKDVME